MVYTGKVKAKAGRGKNGDERRLDDKLFSDNNDDDDDDHDDEDGDDDCDDYGDYDEDHEDGEDYYVRTKD